jgi:hypothetical protein
MEVWKTERMVLWYGVQMNKLWKIVDNNGASIHTYIAIAHSPEEALRKCNDASLLYSPRDCKEITGGVFIFFEDVIQ